MTRPTNFWKDDNRSRSNTTSFPDYLAVQDIFAQEQARAPMTAESKRQNAVFLNLGGIVIRMG